MSGRTALMALAWAWVALPFAYGVYNLLLKLAQLFG
ncbi:MFS transporter small subunit [Actinomadura luzonensis]